MPPTILNKNMIHIKNKDDTQKQVIILFAFVFDPHPLLYRLLLALYAGIIPVGFMGSNEVLVMKIRSATGKLSVLPIRQWFWALNFNNEEMQTFSPSNSHSHRRYMTSLLTESPSLYIAVIAFSFLFQGKTLNFSIT